MKFLLLTTVDNKLEQMQIDREVLLHVLELNSLDFTELPNGEFTYIIQWEKTVTLNIEKTDSKVIVNHATIGPVLVNTGTITKELNHN